jgi:hypothetical protein
MLDEDRTGQDRTGQRRAEESQEGSVMRELEMMVEWSLRAGGGEEMEFWGWTRSPHVHQ